jgi:prevent-host-death family protein
MRTARSSWGSSSRLFAVRLLCEHTFVFDHDPNLKGNVAELKIAAEATRLGIDVLRPMTEHGRYDLVFELHGELLRIQCKWGCVRDGVIRVATGGNRLTPSGYKRSTYSAEEIDAVAVYCGELDACYLLPMEVVAGKHQVHLRLKATRNRQRACLNWASDYELNGAVAQLEERCRGTAEARGSSPLSSTSSTPVTVGANEYRNHFGWYMQRAAAGESFLITRRGRPYARLAPPFEQLLEPAAPKLELVN